MSTFESELFLGFFVDTTFQEKLMSLDSKLKSFYIQRGDDTYLSQYYFKERQFLGKFIGTSCNLSHLELASLNIYSLLKNI